MGPLRLLYCDNAGVRRCRVLPECVEDASVGLPHAVMSIPCHADDISPGSGLSATGESRLTADQSTIKEVPWCKSHSIALADVLEKSGKPWSCCPRSALKAVIDKLQQKHGVQLLVGFEVEFLLLKPSDKPSAVAGWEPVDQSVYCQSSSVDAVAPVLDDMVSTLQAMGITVMQYHAESAPGQFEMVMGPAGALDAADQLLLCREALRGVARKHGLEVSYLPKAFDEETGNGCHVHFSLWKGDQDLMALRDANSSTTSSSSPYPPLSALASSFLAGLLKHLPGLLVFIAPSTNSYQRLKPKCWAGANVIWGYDNRDAAIRIACPGDLRTLNAELKPFDGSTNPHLGLAAIISAGMLGLSAGEQLPPFDQGTGSAAAEEEEQQQQGQQGTPTQKPALLPSSLKEALTCYHQDTAFQEALAADLGPELMKAYIAVRVAEEAYDPEGLKAISNWAFCY